MRALRTEYVKFLRKRVAMLGGAHRDPFPQKLRVFGCDSVQQNLAERIATLFRRNFTALAAATASAAGSAGVALGVFGLGFARPALQVGAWSAME
eukprot:gene7527-biopygen7551